MHAAGRARPELITRAVDALLDPALEAVVELVLTARDGACEAHAIDGSVRFTAGGPLEVRGRNPLGRQDPAALSPLVAERTAARPARAANSYPFAYESVAQLFDDPAAPDVAVVRTAAPHLGHAGDHGSPGVVQARAPLSFSGAGVRPLGVIEAAARVVDVAPTLAALLGGALRGADGRVLDEVLDPDARPPAHVVALLLDGTNANVLADAVARGELPHLAGLLAPGTTYAHGAMASLPTVTLANRTSAITGRHPGHHGILHNAWYDRARHRRVVTNSMDTWPTAMDSLRPGTETLHHAAHLAAPGCFTAAVNEPCDTGADYSSFAFLRAGELIPFPERADEVPHASVEHVRAAPDYAWHTMVDHLAVEQAVGIWGGAFRDRTYPAPTLCWISFSLTDAAFHDGGPYSERAAAALRDTDARVGEVVAAVEAAGAFERTAWCVLADHGMQETDPAVTGDWAPALVDAGIPFRDEGFGFLYLGEDVVDRDGEPAGAH